MFLHLFLWAVGFCCVLFLVVATIHDLVRNR